MVLVCGFFQYDFLPYQANHDRNSRVDGGKEQSIGNNSKTCSFLSTSETNIYISKKYYDLYRIFNSK